MSASGQSIIDELDNELKQRASIHKSANIKNLAKIEVLDPISIKIKLEAEDFKGEKPVPKHRRSTYTKINPKP